MRLPKIKGLPQSASQKRKAGSHLLSVLQPTWLGFWACHWPSQCTLKNRGGGQLLPQLLQTVCSRSLGNLCGGGEELASLPISPPSQWNLSLSFTSQCLHESKPALSSLLGGDCVSGSDKQEKVGLLHPRGKGRDSKCIFRSWLKSQCYYTC